MALILEISDSERNNIRLLHKSFSTSEFIMDESKKSFDGLLTEIKNQLNFQKKIHLHHISMLNENDGETYLWKIQNDYISGMFPKNKVIFENFKIFTENLITESIIDVSNKLDSFNNFLTTSLVFNLGFVSEQTNQGGTINSITDTLSKSVNYIKEKGVGFIFENLRTALMSMVGTAIQIALSFTGVGTIANEIAWGILTLYDSYEYFVNKKSGSLSNLIIDLICLLTAGTFGKLLKNFVNMGGNTIGVVLSKFMNGGLGKFLKPILSKIQNGSTIISTWLSKASNFMKTKMGIGWASNLLGKVNTFFNDLSLKFGEFLGKNVAQVVSPSLRNVATLGAKFNPSVFSNLMAKSEGDLVKMIGTTVSKSHIAAVEKYAKEHLKEKPTQEALNQIDKLFGTKMGDIYAIYLNGTKLAKHNTKLSSKLKGSDIGSELLRGNDFFSKSDNLINKIQTTTSNL